MRPFVTMLMFLACLLYGFMPAMAARPLAQAEQVTMQQATPHAHHGHGAEKAQDTTAEETGDPCPHRGGSAHAPFCAACLVLPPFLAAAAKGKGPFSYPAPGPAAMLTAALIAPTDPPPRF